MTRTDIPDPTPLDEAIWDLYVLMDDGMVPYVRGVVGAALRLFPRRYGRRVGPRYAEDAETRSVKQKARRAADPEKYRAQSRRWQQAHPDKQAAAGHSWYVRNRETVMARQRLQRAEPEVAERRREYQREWSTENRDKEAAYARAYRERRLPDIRQYEADYARRWRAAHRDEYNAKSRERRAAKKAEGES